MAWAKQAKSGAFALSKAFKAAQKPRKGQNKLQPQARPAVDSFIWSFCPSGGLQGVSKATARAEQAKIKAYALPEAFKVSQKPRQGQNKQKSKLVPFQRPSRRLKSHGKGRTSFNRRPVLRLILSSGASALSEAFKVSQKPRQGQNKLQPQARPAVDQITLEINF